MTADIAGLIDTLNTQIHDCWHCWFDRYP